MIDNATQDYSDSAAARAVRYARGQAARAIDTTAVPTAPAGYTLIRRIHVGGQGTVYEALHDATARRVAIKIMHAGLGRSMYNEARFRREVEILTQLRHPHIVTLHDGGITPSQHYFLVMDYVDGLPLDAWVRSHEPTVRKTVQLFLKICKALAAAHLRGIVHRDLKPSNIRVDDDGAPRVLDFGLAKMSVGSAHGDMTASGQFIGSLPWATPEQARGRPELIDVRTDVYALGLVLFHLLTDDTPYDVDGPVRDVLNTVLDATPARPGTLRDGIPTDLDTIVTKCLSKEPQRRYHSAGELAADIDSFLNGAAIAARRDSTWYMLRKLLGKHRWLTGAGITLIGVTLVYATTLTVLFQRTTAAERRATDMARIAGDRGRFAQTTVEFLVDEVSTLLQHAPQSVAVRRQILEGAYERLEILAEDDTNNPAFWRDRARAHEGLGEIAMSFSDYEVALGHFHQAVELRQQLVTYSPAQPDDRADLSIGLVKLGDVHKRLACPADMLALYERALAIDEDLVAQHPDNDHYLDNLLWSYQRLGYAAMERGAVALASELHLIQLEIAQKLTARDADNGLRWYGLSATCEQLLALASMDQDHEAVENYALRSLDSMRRALELDPGNPFYIRSAAIVYLNNARFMGAGANDVAREGLALAQSLVDQDPTLPDNHTTLASIRLRMVSRATRAGDPAAALAHCDAAIAAARQAVELSPNSHIAWLRLLRGWTGRAQLVRESDPAAFDAAVREVLAILRHAAQSIEMRDEFVVDAAKCAMHVRFDEPAAMVDILDDLTLPHSDLTPPNAMWVGRGYAALGRCDVAVPLLEAALERLDDLDMAKLRLAQHALDGCDRSP